MELKKNPISCQKKEQLKGEYLTDKDNSRDLEHREKNFEV